MAQEPSAQEPQCCQGDQEAKMEERKDPGLVLCLPGLVKPHKDIHHSLSYLSSSISPQGPSQTPPP